MGHGKTCPEHGTIILTRKEPGQGGLATACKTLKKTCPGSGTELTLERLSGSMQCTAVNVQWLYHFEGVGKILQNYWAFLHNLVFFCKILQQWCQLILALVFTILHCFAQFYTVLHNFAEFCQHTFAQTCTFCAILHMFAHFCTFLHNRTCTFFAKFCTILQIVA